MSVDPFVKWVGGKRWLLKSHPGILPRRSPGRTYHEPFLGGGAVYFGAYPEHRPASLSDVNPRLVDTYIAVRDHVEDLILELARHPYESAHYYEVRRRLNREHNAPIVLRAAWFLVINKYGFNGLYRVNGDGAINVPFGRYANPTLCDAAGLRACSAALRGVEIRCVPFAVALADAHEGDAVFIDPPYVPASDSANFTGYSADGFGPADQSALVVELRRLDRIGASWTLTNSDTPASRALYAEWPIIEAQRSGGINSDGKKRGKVGEIIVRGRVP